MSDSTNKDEAIRAFEAAKIPLIPLQGKKPSIKDWPRTPAGRYGEKELVGINYGVVLPDGWLVVDIDPRAFIPDDHPTRRLAQAVGSLDGSFMVSTGGGGLHIYFRIPLGFRCVNALKEYPGIEFKSLGRQVVGPGSIHPETARVYEVLKGKRPQDALAAPSKLLDLIAKPKMETAPSQQLAEYQDDANTQGRYVEYLINMAEPSIEGRGGNDNAFRVAARGRDFGLPPDTTLELLLGFWNQKCNPPWDASELKPIVLHAYKYAKGALGNAHPAAQFEIVSERPSVPTPSNRDARTLLPVDLSTLPEPAPAPMIWGNRLAIGHPNTLYGNGGQGKSFLALALGTCIAAGRRFCGLDLPMGKVIYLDWELSQDGQTRRAYQIARGLGLEAPPKGLLYLAPMSSLPDLINLAAQMVEREKPILIIVDSMGPAAGGSPEDAEETIRLFNSIRRLGVSSLILDHQSKMQQGQDSKHKTIFGSAYKYNLSRSVLHLDRISSSNGELRLLIRHTKSNFGPYTDDFALLARFSTDSISFEAVDQTLDPAFAKTLTAGDKLLAALGAHGPATAEILAAAVNEHPKTVKNELTRLRKSGMVKETGKDGQKTIWALAGSSIPLSHPPMGGIQDTPQ